MTIAKATVSSHLIAETEDVVTVEGNYYVRRQYSVYISGRPNSLNIDTQFPSSSIKPDVSLEISDLHTTCPWKGLASYYNITVNGILIFLQITLI